MVSRVEIDGGSGDAFAWLVCAEYGVIAALSRNPELQNQFFTRHRSVGGKPKNVRLREIAWLYRNLDLTHKLAVRPLQQRGHDRRPALTGSGGPPNADFGNNTQSVV